MFDQPVIRLLLIVGSIVTLATILGRVRKSKMQIEDTLFWFGFSAVLLLLALVPDIAFWAANLLGFQSPINLVYLIIIFLLLVKQFFMSITISQMDSKLRILAQKVALNEQRSKHEK